MRLALILHLAAIGTWFGCVLVEAVIELSAARNPDLRSPVARLHDKIDRWVEAPCFITVLATGVWMLDWSRFSGLYAAKVLMGLMAVLVNVYCVYVVVRRQKALARGDGLEAARRSRQTLWCLVFGIPPGLAALGIGLHLLGIV